MIFLQGGPKFEVTPLHGTGAVIIYSTLVPHFLDPHFPLSHFQCPHTNLPRTRWYNFWPCTPILRGKMHSVTDRRTDRRTDDMMMPMGFSLQNTQTEENFKFVASVRRQKPKGFQLQVGLPLTS